MNADEPVKRGRLVSRAVARVREAARPSRRRRGGVVAACLAWGAILGSVGAASAAGVWSLGREPAADAAPANADSPSREAARTAEEVTSEIGDLWRDRDAFYLRVDGRTPREAGVAPAGSREMLVRLEAMTRGRPWPGRWTMIEVELRSAVGETLSLSFTSPATSPAVPPRPGAAKSTPVPRQPAGSGTGGEVVVVTLPAAGADRQAGWARVRLAIPETARDLMLRAGSDPAGGVALGSPLQFRRVRFVDDRRTYWSDGWSVVREAGRLKVRPATGSPLAIPMGTGAGSVRVAEVGRLRVLLANEGAVDTGAAIYFDGRVSASTSSSASVPLPWLRALAERAAASSPPVGDGIGGEAPPRSHTGVTVQLSDDLGRLDRHTPGDADADGYNESRGVYMLRAVEGTRRMTVRLVPAPGAAAAAPVLEIAGLPEGEVTALWQGKVLKTNDRVPPPDSPRPTSVLVVMPEAITAPTDLEVSIAASK